MKDLIIAISVDDDRNVAAVVQNIQEFLVDAPVELSFKIKIKDPSQTQWLDIK